MELSEGILKSIESGFNVVSSGPFYALKYNGVLFSQSGNCRLFANQGAAKSALTSFVKQCFWHGRYWQSCAKQVKASTGYDVDFSATIELLDSYGTTARFDCAENKKMFKDISNELLKRGIFTIEQI